MVGAFVAERSLASFSSVLKQFAAARARASCRNAETRLPRQKSPNETERMQCDFISSPKLSSIIER
jgi:hypothetical protein